MNEYVSAYAAIRPNFKRANKIADELLRNTGYPKAPIPLIELVEAGGWKVQYEDLHGADGYTAKVEYKNTYKYVIYIAKDMNIEKYSQLIIEHRQRFTIAHEIGHILLHSHIDWHNVSEEQDAILEVEANWFASRLLMPDYVFRHISDLDPDQLAEKCSVNYTAAQKRIKNLTAKVKNQLIREASNRVDLDDYYPGPIKEIKMDESEQIELLSYIESMPFMEVAITNEDCEIICFVCGQDYWTGNSDILPLRCMNCGADALDIG